MKKHQDVAQEDEEADEIPVAYGFVSYLGIWLRLDRTQVTRDFVDAA